ncbi:MAG: hypothetical protein IH830_03065 [Planctomycetes bacterium]|nr:hypothetical protein [Planctomycetota bacterium]
MDSSETFDTFSKEVLNVRTAWELWELLYQAPPEGIGTAVGNLALRAPTYYRYSVWSLLSLVVLAVCRLADPKVDKQGNRNLCMELIWDESTTEPLNRQEKHAKTAMVNADKIINGDEFRKLRNRILAHNDLDTITGKTAAGVPFDTIRDAVGWIARFRERIAAAREGREVKSSTGEGSLPPPGDVEHCRAELEVILKRLGQYSET